MDFISTFKGSYAGPFYPAGWDYKKIQKITALGPKEFAVRQSWWHKDFTPVVCSDASAGVESMNAMMGYEIFNEVREAAHQKRELAMILPVGPMGMYRWALYFSLRHGVSWRHVHGFNMDEWADADGNSAPPGAPGSFQGAMEQALYGPLGKLTVPKPQRNFATRKLLPQYPDKIARLRKNGAKLVVVYGIGRACHIAFWEPHFAGEYESVKEWRADPFRVGAKLHPLTIEQNSLHSFASRMTLIPLFANSIGPGLFTNADYCIGGADGAHGPLNWQGQSIWMTLRYGPDTWVPSSWMPTMAGRLFVIKALAGPLVPEAN
ncbi:MAG: glucosamine-6-phosphate isomerase [Planctomycetes bacterium]|nr:glucosamine-6-phosphate isomerase [Planctomycetota bacterium]